MTDKWDGWTCIPGRPCGGTGFMRDAEAEIQRLRSALSWYATAEPVELYRTSEIDDFQRRAKDALFPVPTEHDHKND